MKHWLFFLVALIGVPPGFASGQSPMDFAKGLVVDGEGDASIYRFTLPEYVYEGMVRHDFGDIRVFNAQDEEVPFSLRSPGDERFRQDIPQPRSLLVFPLFLDEKQKEQSDRMSVRIAMDGNGAIIDVNNTPGIESHHNRPAFYLVDLSKTKDKPQRLSFTWSDASHDQMVHIRISESRDLDHWVTLVGSAVLADIRFGNETLARNSVDLPGFSSPYLKVTVLDRDTDFRLTGITGHYSAVRVQDEKRWRWSTIQGKPSESGPLDFIYELDHPLPYERINISFPQKNTLARVTLKSKNASMESWRTVYQGLLYNLTMKGTAFEKTEVECGMKTDTQWLLSVDPDGGGIGKGTPTLELGWMPHTLYFVARGQRPFKVAYGSGRVGPGKDGVNPLLRDMGKDHEEEFVKEATLHTVVELGGRKQLEIPRDPVPWKRIVLWVILLGGVCLCAWMALSLYRQMGRSRGDDEDR